MSGLTQEEMQEIINRLERMGMSYEANLLSDMDTEENLPYVLGEV